MTRYSQDPALAALGNPNAADPRDRCPAVSPEAVAFLHASETLSEALFDAASLFRIPLTNNIPWFEDGDPDRPIYHAGEFIETITGLFGRFGWTPPAAPAVTEA